MSNGGFVIPRKHFPPYALLGLGWVVLGLVLFLVAVWLDIRDAKLSFHRQAAAVHTDLLRKLQVNEVVLAGFAAHFSGSGETDRRKVAEYVHDMLSRYPHIHQMEAQRFVARQSVRAFEQAMQNGGFDGYRVHAANGSGKLAMDPQPFHYPITFVAPANKASEQLLGLDVRSVNYFQSAIARAIDTAETTASAPYPRTEGGRAYTLFRTAGPQLAESTRADRRRYPGTLVSLLIDGNELVNRSLFPSADITLRHTGSESNGILYRVSSRLADRVSRAIFPRFSYSRDLNAVEQPFAVQIEKQFSWDAISLPVVLALGTFVASAAILLAFYIRAIRASEAQRASTERALRESEARYRNLVENAAEAIVVFDTDGRRLADVNPEAERLFGLGRDELVGLDPFSLSPDLQPDGLYSRESGWQKLEEALAGAVPQFEWLHHDAKGNPLYCEVRVVRLPDASRQRVRGSLTDITERRRAQQKLVNTKNFLEALYDASLDMIFLFSRRGYLVDVNQNALNESGYSRQELLGKDFEVLMGANETREAIAGKAREALAGRRPVFQCVARRKNGEEFPIDIHLSRVPGNRKAGQEKAYVLAVVHDITERKRAQDALSQEKERAQTTLQSIGDGVITTDVAGVVDYVNPVAEQLTGWHSGDAKGLPLGEAFRVLDEQTREPLPDPVQRCLTKNQIVSHTEHTLLIRDDGSEFAVKLTVAPIRDRRGSVSGAVLVLHDVTEMREIARQLTYQATHDPLTGLVNRREFERRLDRTIDSARSNERVHALCYIDLDQFKVVNDTCGHTAGDELLAQLSDLLRAKTRDSDTLGRLGGDEFGLLLVACPLEKAQEIAESLRQLIEEFRFSWDDKRFVVGASVGLVPISGESGNLTDVLTAADAACYMAKALGRNRVYVSRPGDAALAQHQGEMQWVQHLRQALEADRFELFGQRIQPIADRYETYHRYEVLVRLLTEEGEPVRPGAFLPAAERYHLMPAIDRWVVEHAFDAVCDSRIRGYPVTLSVNLSGQSLGDDRFLDFVLDQLTRPEMIPELVCFEITETAAIAHMGSAMYFIARLREMGCRFALDDFGSGLSSFAYLKSMPVDYLKIDGRFVRDVASDATNRAMVGAITQIGHVMGIHTIAECAESDAILDELKALRVDYAQGIAVAEPMPLDECLGDLNPRRQTQFGPLTNEAQKFPPSSLNSGFS